MIFLSEMIPHPPTVGQDVVELICQSEWKMQHFTFDHCCP